jgi:hypothetical protein
MSKHNLLNHWPTPTIVRDIASFVGFIQFYSKFIPCFELCTEPLQNIMLREYTEPIGDMWMSVVHATFNSLRNSILDDSCLCHFNPSKLTVLHTKFSSKGFGYVVCQPDLNSVSLELVLQFMLGNGFHFLTKTDGGILYPVAFGGQRAQGNEKHLLFYLGKAFCSDYTMNKFYHMCYGHHFVWITDCYAVKFVFSYNGANQTILHLPMRLMGWDVDIGYHCNKHLVDANYWSRMDCNLCYNASFRTYLRLVDNLRRDHPAPTEIPMKVEHIPYYQGPCFPNLQHSLDNHDDNVATTNAQDQAPAADIYYAGALLLTCIVTSGKMGFTSLLNRPIQFGTFSSANTPNIRPILRVLYNSELPVIAYSVSHLPWAVYGFNLGHFVLTIKQRNFHFSIVLACDPHARDCAL